MTDVLVFALIGLGPGALIAGVALALVLQYRGSGVINLSAGAVATLGAYVFYTLRNEGCLLFPLFDLGDPWSTAPALLLTLVTCAVVGAASEFWLFRSLRTAPPLAKLILSLGLMLTLQAVFLLRFGTSGQSAPAVLPNGVDDTVTIFGTPIPMDRFYLAGITIALAVGLMVLYRRTLFGLATRAAAENEANAMLAGISPSHISAANTVFAFVVAGMFGVLAAPSTQLDPSTITLAVVPALTAALAAGFTSFSIAAAAGLAMGMVQSIVTYLLGQDWFIRIDGASINGLEWLVYFFVIVAILYLRGDRLPARGTVFERRLPAAPEAQRVLVPLMTTTVVMVAALVLLPAGFRQALTTNIIGFVVCLAMVVIIGFVGQVSLIPVALGGVAAFAVQRFTVDMGIAFPVAPILAVATATFVGLIAAVPALRVRGVNLAILTLAAGVALERFGFSNTAWGENSLLPTVPAPKIFGHSLGDQANFPGWDGSVPSPVIGLMCLAVALVLAVAVVGLRRSRFGSCMLAVRSNERAAAASGISVKSVKIIASGLSSAIAGVAGVLVAYNLGAITAPRFGIAIALAFVAFAYLGGITTVAGAVAAASFVPGGIADYALQEWTGMDSNTIFLIGGLSLIYTVVVYPQGIALTTQQMYRSAVRKYRPVVEATASAMRR